jgi:small redox-active disulfide protein 2
MLSVKILGSGCPNCRRLEAETCAALDTANIPYEISKVTEYEEIAAYGVMQTPALVINEQVVSSGRIPKRDQIVIWAQQLEQS